MAVEIDTIISKVSSQINGRFANAGNNAKHLLEVVEKAGDGNYLEIGVLHGGSLCSVALLKKALGHKGICIGVDPFDGKYYSRIDKEDRFGGLDTIQNVQGNLDNFGLDNVKLVQARSPEFVVDVGFNVAYIDGDHSFEGAWADWKKVAPITSHFVVIHDYGAIPGVTLACEKILDDPSWSLYLRAPYTFIVERAG